ncbi:hypothetical protein MRX96_043315 [Rhipicephalus microplus]
MLLGKTKACSCRWRGGTPDLPERARAPTADVRERRRTLGRVDWNNVDTNAARNQRGERGSGDAVRPDLHATLFHSEPARHRFALVSAVGPVPSGHAAKRKEEGVTPSFPPFLHLPPFLITLAV